MNSKMEERHYVEVNGTYMVVPRCLMWYEYNTKTNMWNGKIVPMNKKVIWVPSAETGYYVEELRELETESG